MLLPCTSFVQHRPYLVSQSYPKSVSVYCYGVQVCNLSFYCDIDLSPLSSRILFFLFYFSCEFFCLFYIPVHYSLWLCTYFTLANSRYLFCADSQAGESFISYITAKVSSSCSLAHQSDLYLHKLISLWLNYFVCSSTDIANQFVLQPVLLEKCNFSFLVWM